jgi:hypothetical protein
MENTALPHVPEGTVSHLGGALPHSSHYVCAFLDRKFPNQWVERGEPIPWPPHSPDLTPWDFLFWGYMKDNVYHKKCKMQMSCITELSELEMLANTK